MTFAGEPRTLSLTHHTFLVGSWKDAGSGAVLVTQLDDPECVVLILKPGDVAALIVALEGARSPEIALVTCGLCGELWNATHANEGNEHHPVWPKKTFRVGRDGVRRELRQ